MDPTKTKNGQHNWNPPLITVAIPSYNHAAFIEQAIRSVLNQDVKDIEVIVIDDASTDNTAEIAEALSREDARVRVYRNERNLGPSGASHRYLELARGKYLCPLPSDDFFAPGKLKAQLDILESQPKTALVATEASFVNEAGKPFRNNQHFASHLFDLQQRSRFEWLRYFFNVGNCICASSVMVRTDIFKEFKPDLRLLNLQDYDCWVRIALAGHDIVLISSPLTIYRIRDKEANLSAPTAATRARNLFEHTQVLKRFYQLSKVSDLVQLLPQELPQTPSLHEESYVQHRLSLHAWRLGRSHHRVFALDNWFRLLGDSSAQKDLEKWGLTNRFLAEKSSFYPLAISEANSIKGKLQLFAEQILPWSIRNSIVHKIKKSYQNDYLGSAD
jgi:glycosyltransferase involved in cell wall biosynthesis